MSTDHRHSNKKFLEAQIEEAWDAVDDIQHRIALLPDDAQTIIDVPDIRPALYGRKPVNCLERAKRIYQISKKKVNRVN
jgi:hypothetical protein